MSKALRTNVKPDVSKWEPALEFEGSTETVELPNDDNQKEACLEVEGTREEIDDEFTLCGPQLISCCGTPCVRYRAAHAFLLQFLQNR